MVEPIGYLRKKLKCSTEIPKVIFKHLGINWYS